MNAYYAFIHGNTYFLPTKVISFRPMLFLSVIEVITLIRVVPKKKISSAVDPTGENGGRMADEWRKKSDFILYRDITHRITKSYIKITLIRVTSIPRTY